MVIPQFSLKKIQLDAAGAAATLVLLAGGYFLLIQPPLDDTLADNRLRIQQNRVAETIKTLRHDYVDRLHKLEESHELLLSKASWLSRSDMPEEVLSRIDSLARQCEVQLSRWLPQGHQAAAEYQTQVFSLEGAATASALMRWFALVEEGVPLLDVTHFSVTGPTTPGQTVCTFSCSLKLYLGGQTQPMEVAAARP